MTPRHAPLAAAALVAAHAALAAVWVSGNDLPVGAKDEFVFVELCTDIVFRLQAGDAGGAWVALRDAYYPPGSRVAGIAALLAGGSYHAMVAAQVLLWGPLLVAGTWLAARRTLSGWGALAALALLLGGPAALDSLHRFEPNLGQMGATALALACWLRCDDFRDRRWSLGFGAAVAAGLLADRLGTVPFAAAPVLLSVVRARGAALRGLAMAAVVAGLAVSWWYVFFVGDFFSDVLPQLLAGEIARSGEVIEEAVPLPWRWLQVLIFVPDAQLGLVGGTLALLGLGAALARFRERETLDLLAWVLPGLLLFTLVPKHQPYYTMPLLPGLCVLTAHVGARWAVGPGRWVAVGLIALTQLPPVLTARADTLDLSRGMTSWLLQGLSPLPGGIVGERFPIGEPPRDSGLQLTTRLAELDLGPDEPLVVFASDPMIAESFLVSLARIERGTLEVHGVVLHPGAVRELPGDPAFLFVTPEPAWPDGGLVRQTYIDRLDDTDPAAVIAALDRWGPRSKPVAAARLLSEGHVVTWRIP